jgi:hypothetical protein
MKILNALVVLLLLSSCAKLNKVLDGAENLPEQISKTNKGIESTNEAVRLQKIGESFKVMVDANNRKTLSPIPSDMMSASKIMAEALTSDEALLFIKNYMIKVNEEIFEDTYPLADKGTDAGMALYVDFLHNKQADLLMITLVSGFLPNATLQTMIKDQSEQGAYRDVLFASLKMRADFYNNVMLDAGLIGSGKKLETLGQIAKAVEYTDKLDFICKLDFVDQISMKVTGFTEEMNKNLSASLDKNIALNNWKKVLEKAQSDFKAASFSKDPDANAKALKDYTEQHNSLIYQIQAKIDSYPKP